MTSKPHILDRILQTKREEVATKIASVPLDVIESKARACEFVPRGFRAAISQAVQQKQPAIIAELKKASPSKGVIRPDFDVFTLARSYVKGGATCLSVLTDLDYFQGHDSFLRSVRDTVELPLLRKDFIICPYQVFESRLLGADAILLIAAALPASELETLHHLARGLGLDVLIEVHSVQEYQAIAHLGDDAVIGVNNRDLKTFTTHLNTTFEVIDALKPSQWCITESGIHEKAQVDLMMQKGVYGFLIGEAFMRYDQPEDGITALFDTKA